MADKPTIAWDETSPAGSQSRALGDDRIRELKTQLREVIAEDHNMASSGQSATTGQHNKATLLVNADDPTEQGDAGIVYTKDVNGKAELFYKDEDGNEIQLTSAGKLIPGDATVTVDKLATDAVINAKVLDGAITPAKMTRNIVSINLSDDFSTTSASYTTRTGATITLTGIRTGANVLLKISSCWQSTNTYFIFTGCVARINIDSGTYLYIGGIRTQAAKSGGTENVTLKGFIGGEFLITGLAAGNHTFVFEIKDSVGSYGTAYNGISSLPEDFYLTMIAEEV